MDPNFFDEFTLAAAQCSDAIFSEVYSTMLNASNAPDGYTFWDRRICANIVNLSDTSFETLNTYPSAFGFPAGYLGSGDAIGGSLKLIGANDAFHDFNLSSYSNANDWLNEKGYPETANRNIWAPKKPSGVDPKTTPLPPDADMVSLADYRLFIFLNDNIKMAFMCFTSIEFEFSIKSRSLITPLKEGTHKICIGMGEIDKGVSLYDDTNNHENLLVWLMSKDMSNDTTKNAFKNGVFKNFTFSPFLKSPFPATPAEPSRFTTNAINGLSLTVTAGNGTDGLGTFPYYRMKINGRYQKDQSAG